MSTAVHLVPVLSQWVMKGVTDNVTTCDCCGRQKLKRTVVVVPLDADGNEDGDACYFGTGCAAVALRRTQSWVTGAAQAATLKHNERERWARRMVSVYGPVEFSTVREKAAAWFSRNPMREGQPGASVQIDRILSEARAQLRDTALGPTRPHSVSDFRPHLVVMTPDRSEVSWAAALSTEDAAAREEAHRFARRHAESLRGGHALTVWALDVDSARDVAHAQVARGRYAARRGDFA
ncbi:hypothetical protein ACIP9H_33375 [Streptomyces sp. NPDC088732]|uniref:hypothetical protein n=1 Tax=Streptomyces sp. NPDC088732 TaxID=3365879 RepID=UPI0037F1C32D